ncbi:MAG: anthranilate phosphoribosyltransferase [Hyphomonadaceae bacterium]|nr:anthranilate phosphoribosyltransferase [Hyphomonadaceae bacterium]
MMDIKHILNQMIEGERLSEPQFRDTFSAIFNGELSDPQIAALLMGFETQGVTDIELYLGAQIMRDHMIPIEAPDRSMDIVGTGGDGLTTYNISTACTFVCAGAGAPIAKHGNRAVSSKSGASDVLRELGVKLDISPEKTKECIEKAGVCFLFAPNHHKAMGHVAPARAALGIRTIFNRLGPLSNPARVKQILVGVYDDALRSIYAKALRKLGTQSALIVHGSDGMDEITTTGPTFVSELRDGKITDYEISPEHFGFERAGLDDLKGGDPAHNATALQALLKGQAGPYRDIVLMNSGAALFAANKADSIQGGIELARSSIDKGAAMKALENLVAVSNG